MAGDGPVAEGIGRRVSGLEPALDAARRAVVERRLRRKLDARCALFVLIYVLNYLDRNNMAAARLKGLQDGLRLDNMQCATCLSVLFCGNLVSNAFSALVGAGVLSNMHGVLGHAAWRWLFFVEGAATMAVAAAAALVLPDLPHNTRGFSGEERLVAQLRMTEDVGEADADAADRGVLDGLWMALRDAKIYVMMLAFTAYVVGLSFNAFFPTLTGTLGFGYVPTLLMSSPPWVFACIVSVAVSWNSDRTQEKSWHIIASLLVGLVGFAMSMATLNVAARYVALFLQTSSYAGYIVIYSWISSSFPRPPAKCAVTIAIVNAFGSLGNVAGSYVWDLQDDGYRKSYGIVLAMFCVAIGGCWVFRMTLTGLNRKLEQAEARHSPHQVCEDEAIASPDEALRTSKGFRYLL